jgi:hypothetical protein
MKVLAALAVGAVFAAAPTAASGAATKPLVTGIAGIGDYRGEAFDHARLAGARMVRLALNWPEVAPEEEPESWEPENPADPHYNWAYIDTGVVEAIRAGLTPMLLVDGAPEWAQRCKASPGTQLTELCDPDPAALEAFAKAAARRYSGEFLNLPRVRFWQGLNEPNLGLFFLPQYEGELAVSPYLYRRLINAFYAGVKAVHRSNLVIAAGLSPTEVAQFAIGPLRFARLLLCMRGTAHPHPTKDDCEGGVHFDAFDIHPYTSGSPTHESSGNDIELGDLDKLQTLLRAADRAGRIKGDPLPTELWSTEFSWDSKPPDPGGLAMPILCRWTAEALYRAWRAGMAHFFWYSIRDGPYEPERPFGETLQAGLFFRGPTVAEDEPKKVFYAFRFPFVAYPRKHHLFFWGRTANSKPARVEIQLWKRGRWHRAGVAQANEVGIFHGLVHSRYGSKENGRVRAVYGAQRSLPFSMRPVEDFFQPPFG